jgi:uncharacterized membrane protein YphA (DoxX/SURF4 family)
VCASLVHVSRCGGREARRWTLQRLFSSFPAGSAGIGLLLLRATVGAALVGQGALSLGREVAGPWSRVADALSILSGCALVTGILTPAAGVLAAAFSLVRALAPPTSGGGALGGGGAPALLFVIAVTVALLGPGAFSLDARLFGRREIVVPRAPRDGGLTR